MESNVQEILSEFDSKKDTFEYLNATVTRLITKLVDDRNIVCSSINGRVKDRSSLEKKIQLKKKYNTLSEITDVVGVRIITYYTDDVDKIADLIEQEFDVDKENTIDKRKAMDPDRFGYMSLHYIVKLNEERGRLAEYSSIKGLRFEVQIRTILQHTWAEIEHDLGYKSRIEIPAEIRREFSRLSGLLELADKEFLEIKSKLNSYQKDIERQVAEKDISEDMMLDKISLDKILTSDENMKSFTRKICQIIPDTKLYKANIVATLKELYWLNITKVKELERMLERNKEIAYYIALHVLHTVKGPVNFTSDIGIFYLCFAELLMQYDSEEDIVRYLRDNQIGNENTYLKVARNLLAIYQSAANLKRKRLPNAEAIVQDT